MKIFFLLYQKRQGNLLGEFSSILEVAESFYKHPIDYSPHGPQYQPQSFHASFEDSGHLSDPRNIKIVVTLSMTSKGVNYFLLYR